MSTTWSYFLVLHALITSLISSLTVIAIASNATHYQQIAIVHIVNALPSKSQQLNIRCKSSKADYGDQILNCGEGFQWSVKQKAVYYCAGLWERNLTSWHAFQPRRDANHGTVFWKVEENGIFLSWDNSTWKRKATWFSE